MFANSNAPAVIMLLDFVVLCFFALDFAFYKHSIPFPFLTLGKQNRNNVVVLRCGFSRYFYALLWYNLAVFMCFRDTVSLIPTIGVSIILLGYVLYVFTYSIIVLDNDLLFVRLYVGSTIVTRAMIKKPIHDQSISYIYYVNRIVFKIDGCAFSIPYPRDYTFSKTHVPELFSGE